MLRPYNGLLNNTRNIEFNDSDSSSGSRSHFNNLKKHDFSNSKSNINDDNDNNSNNDNNQDNSNNNGDNGDDDDNDDDDDIHSDDNDNNDSKKNSYDDNDNCEKKTDSKIGKTMIKEILPATEISKKEKISSQKSISHLLGDNYLAHQVRTYVQYWNL